MNTQDLEDFMEILQSMISIQNPSVSVKPIPVLPLLRGIQDTLLFFRNILDSDEPLTEPRGNPEVRFREDITPDVMENSMTISQKIYSFKVPFRMMQDASEISDDLDEMIDWFSFLMSRIKGGISSSIRLSSDWGNETILDERNRLLEENLQLKRSLNKRNRRLKFLSRKIKRLSSKATDHD